MSYGAKAVPLGLVAAWVVNDAEEWVTMAPWSARNTADLAARVPIRLLWPKTGMSPRQAHIAIGIVGAGIGVATGKGLATGGRSPLFRASLLAFGMHGFVHAAQSLLLRRYTPGVVTGMGVVIPFWLWARHIQLRAGMPRPTKGQWLAASTILASLPAVVAIAGRCAEAGRPR